MDTFIALLKGINVGGHNKLPMQGLVEILDDLDLRDIKTYIQSGNIVFESKKTDLVVLEDQIRSVIQRSYGFSPEVFLLSVEEMEQVIATNPYPEADEEPKTLQVYFLKQAPPRPNLEKLKAVKRDSERFSLGHKVFYLYAPEGIGGSKLAERVERALGVSVTARNWRSVCKILAMAQK